MHKKKFMEDADPKLTIHDFKKLFVARISFGGLENLPENVKKLRCLFAKKSPKLCAGEIRKIITTLSI
jgi:hypothetical protein